MNSYIGRLSQMYVYINAWRATYIEIRFSANRIIGLLSAGVTIYMGSYWIKYGKFMHAGLVACVSFVVCSLNIRRSF